MTVKELISILNAFPEDTRVVVQGYEDGFDDISVLQQVQIRDWPDPKWFYGKYEQSDEGMESAVLLFGRSRGDE